MTILWRDGLSVGNDWIDSDHQHLIALINTTQQALTSDLPMADLQKVIDELRDYTHAHFAMEERMMITLSYAKYDLHKHAHLELIEQLAQATKPIQEIDQTQCPTTARLPDGVRENLIALLRHWLLDHIVKEDMQYRPLLAEKPRSFAP
ncbi:bacteriohemerythrin [Denitratisoma oestradiolicum]|uniref:Hemerythrin-like metal-binding domain n=1 Tax=Denitratisoma oestradiolicum TaxID=311182 RepID=A0A6S6YM83_9PROT|nr:hemerythrin family protein [Denitratisoma oestradiolicum]CAB1368844.1 Hemerythrin-like metal-binding domain [Denitratisoma oestradiolicum]